MRQIGTLPDEDQARRLADYLLTLDITTRLDRTGDGSWIVWVHREDRLEQARRELEQFLRDPADPMYQGVSQAARKLRQRASREERRHLRNTISLSGGTRFRPPERCPLTFGLIALSLAVALAENFGADPSAPARWLAIDFVPPIRARLDPVDSGVPPIALEDPRGVRPASLDRVRSGEVWRVVTPILLHVSMFALVINMLWLYELAGAIELRRGTLLLGFLVLAIAAASNLAQFAVAGNPRFGGMAAVIFGLYGYAWSETQGDDPGGITLRPNTSTLLLIWFLFYAVGGAGPQGFVRLAVGLGVGMLASLVPRQVRRWRP